MKVHFTEATMLDLLAAKLNRPGNGGSGEYAFLRHVRNAAGFDASRTFDAISVSLWPSRGLQMDGYEVKVERGDWVRELRDPAKAEAACQVVDRFWVCAPKGIVRDGELPATWGLMEPTEIKGEWKLVVKVQAPPLHDLTNTKRGMVSRTFLVAMLRSCPGAIPGGKNDPDVRACQKAAADARSEESKLWREDNQRWKNRAEAAERIIRQFEVSTGLSLTERQWIDPMKVDGQAWDEAVGTLRLLATGDKAIRRSRDAVTNAANRLREQADELDKLAPRIEAGA